MTTPQENQLSDKDARLWTALLVLVALIWGNAFVAIKVIVAHVTPLAFITVRFVPVALTFALLLLPIRRREMWLMIRSEWWRLGLLGLLGGVAYNGFLAWGETRIAAGTASLIIALNPAFTYLLSVLFMGERLTWQRSLGIAIAFAGLFVIIRWGSGQAVTLEDAKYAFITLLAPLCWAAYTVIGKGVVSRHPPLLVTGVAMSVAGMVSLLFVTPSLLAQLPTLPGSFWWSLAFLVFLCTVFAFVIWFGALEKMPAGRVASFIYLVPLFANTFSLLMLGERITAPSVAGGIVLVGGVWLVNRR